jgi:hypothetical protein
MDEYSVATATFGLFAIVTLTVAVILFPITLPYYAYEHIKNKGRMKNERI